MRPYHYRLHPIRSAIFGAFSLLFILLSTFLLYLGYWMQVNYTDISFRSIVFTATNNLENADTSIVQAFLLAAMPYLFGGLLIGVIVLMGAALWRMREMKRRRNPNLRCLLLSLVLLIVAIGFSGQNVGLWAYLRDNFHSNTCYQENYVDPNGICTFPETKRNLIYIYLESMETPLAAFPDEDGTIVNAIPQLTKLAQENVSFSCTSADALGGFWPLTSASWTLGALLATSSGVGFDMPIGGNDMSSVDLFMPGLTTLGDILEDAGYRQLFLCGSDSSFAGRDHFFLQHGNYEIIDYARMNELGYCGDPIGWGAYDMDLYACAKDTLTALAEDGTPFNLTMLTVDTHAPDGYLCPLCENRFKDEFLNVYACADAQVAAFVEWIQAQPFYENTTIVITGDHPNMAGHFAVSDRMVYDVLINAAPVSDAGRHSQRILSTVDIFPTVLASLGVEIAGDRLGMGVNLFSTQDTLCESMGGYAALNDALNQSSRFYMDTFTGQPSKKVPLITESGTTISDRLRATLATRTAAWELSPRYQLLNATSLEAYLDLLTGSDYLLLAAVCDEATYCLSDAAREKLVALGLTAFGELEYRQSAVAAARQGVPLLSKTGMEYLHESLEINGQTFVLLSAGWTVGNCAEIFCPQASAVNARGINLVVYDMENNIVIDSVAFDTFAAENGITRR